MQSTTGDLKQQLQQALSELERLRDEIRVDLHLAGMDARDKWNKDFEPRLKDAEKLVGEVTEASKHALHELVDKFQKFRSSLKGGG